LRKRAQQKTQLIRAAFFDKAKTAFCKKAKPALIAFREKL